MGSKARALMASLALCGASSAWALPPLACEGRDPNWVMTLAGPVAQLRHPDQTTVNFQVTHTEIAQGRHIWPQIQTLQSEHISGYVLINETSCVLGPSRWPITVHALYPQGLSGDASQVLLTGCCTVAE